MDSEDEMLKFLGMKDIDDLFEDIPEDVRIEGINLPPGKSEMEVRNEVEGILSKNRSLNETPCFLGGGVYNHYVPSLVDEVLSRSEFYTSYTPYQAEVSQGMLQALFEYQSLICELTGMEAANTSMYDWSTAIGEAALMASRLTRKSEIIVPRAMHRDKHSVLANYCKGPGIRVKTFDYDKETGRTDLDHLRNLVTEDTAGVYIENPNFFGVIEDKVDAVKSVAKDAILIVGVNPISLALLKSPGDHGADIVVGEGQLLGSYPSFGGPLLGIFACLQRHVRKMPGRVIGITTDADGERAFCMTLQTREQHIRREKATSNICSNESLMAVASAVYMSLLGRSGLRRVANECIIRTRQAMGRMGSLDNFLAPAFAGEHFNEFVMKSKVSYDAVHRHLLDSGVHGGLALKSQFPELEESAIFAFTETHSTSDIDRLVWALEGVK
ncbi:MAG: aminomethyl-transferring glycine dehydrogenase subunit GcvPA [Thermoplasmata archaeon]